MEQGRYKHYTNRLRRASKLIDLVDLPLDGIAAIPLIGPIILGLDEIAGVGTAALAALLDVAGCLKDGDFRKAGQELLQGVAETALVALPGLGSVQLVYDLRQYVRDRVADRYVGRFGGAGLEQAGSADRYYWRLGAARNRAP